MTDNTSGPNELPVGGGTTSWRAQQARHPRLLLLLSAKTWMPTSVGMTVRGIDHESKLLATGMTDHDG
jgi:hypothetical protein